MPAPVPEPASDMPWLILPGSAPWPRPPFGAASPPALPTSFLPAFAMPFAISSLLPWSLFLPAAMAQPPSARAETKHAPTSPAERKPLVGNSRTWHVPPPLSDNPGNRDWLIKLSLHVFGVSRSRQRDRATAGGSTFPCD